MAQRADGTGPPEELLRGANTGLYPNSFTPDGSTLIFRQDTREGGHDLMQLSMDGSRSARPLLQSTSNELNGDVSPDGRWLAFESDESGRYEIWVRPFPDVNGGRWKVSNGGGRLPLWARSGRELFYVVGNSALMSAAVEPGSAFVAGVPARLFETPYYLGGSVSLGRTYDISPDGQKFLMIKPEPGPPASIVVVQNWATQLARPVRPAP